MRCRFGEIEHFYKEDWFSQSFHYEVFFGLRCIFQSTLKNLVRITFPSEYPYRSKLHFNPSLGKNATITEELSTSHLGFWLLLLPTSWRWLCHKVAVPKKCPRVSIFHPISREKLGILCASAFHWLGSLSQILGGSELQPLPSAGSSGNYFLAWSEA